MTIPTPPPSLTRLTHTHSPYTLESHHAALPPSTHLETIEIQTPDMYFAHNKVRLVRTHGENAEEGRIKASIEFNAADAMKQVGVAEDCKIKVNGAEEWSRNR